MWPSTPYLAAACSLIGAALYALLCKLNPLGDDETPDAIALGGASLAQEFRRHAAGPRPDWIETTVHSTSITKGAQQDHGA